MPGLLPLSLLVALIAAAPRGAGPPVPPASPPATAAPAAGPVPSAGRIAGTVAITGGESPADPAEAVVWVEGVERDRFASHPRLASPPELVLRMKGKQFEPRVLVALAGEEVAFPNLDPVFHNVFSLSGKNRFDLGLYKDGSSKDRTFRTPGLVRVFCNIHPRMAAWIVVLENPFHAVPGPDGRFVIEDVPGGRYRLTAWHERTGTSSREIQVGAGATAAADFSLDASGYRELPHKNKQGKDYGRSY